MGYVLSEDEKNLLKLRLDIPLDVKKRTIASSVTGSLDVSERDQNREGSGIVRVKVNSISIGRLLQYNFSRSLSAQYFLFSVTFENNS
jgi:hypothetical protein